MAPPTPPIPPGPSARDRDRAPQVDGAASSSPVCDDSATAPTLTARGAGRLPVAEVPFAWQYGRRLLLLDEETRGWTFAELRFDEVDCRYVEVRRATFSWPREAAGALLARGIAFGFEPAERLARALDRWLAAHRSAGPGEPIDA